MEDLIKKCVAEYTKTLNKKSKWYSADISEYRHNLSKLSKSDITTKLNNLKQLNSSTSALSKTVSKEISLLDRNGMFNAKNLTPDKALS